MPLRPRAIQYAGLALLAILATGLSIAALLQGRPVARAVPASTASNQSTQSPVTTPTSTESPSATPSGNLTRVVIVGDASSLASNGWAERAARTLNWDVTNLSAAGMGFTKTNLCPGGCPTFKSVVPAVADAEPDIVVVFGGMADVDIPIGTPSRDFFKALRKALPKAAVVALAPVETKQGQLGWIRLHRTDVKEAVTAIDGRSVDVGNPAFRSGALTANGQEQVAKRVIAALR